MIFQQYGPRKLDSPFFAQCNHVFFGTREDLAPGSFRARRMARERQHVGSRFGVSRVQRRQHDSAQAVARIVELRVARILRGLGYERQSVRNGSKQVVKAWVLSPVS